MNFAFLGIVRGAELSENAMIRAVIERYGLSNEDMEFLKKHPKEFKKFKNDLTSLKERPKFPTRSVHNQKRRQERISEQLSDASHKHYKKRERSIRTTRATIDPATWLRGQYTNEDDQMVCQICKEEMPFRKRDGKHYFEIKEVLSRGFIMKEHEAQYVALCPICAAKYVEFVKNDVGKMAELKENFLRRVDCIIPIEFGDEHTSIQFVESHFHDLKIIIKEEGK